MGTTAIIFLVLMIVATGFTAGVLIYELVGHRKETVSESETTASTAASTVASETAAAQVNATPVAASTPTHEEKYNALPDEVRAFYDEIAQYAAAIDGAICATRKRYEEYSLENNRIVRMTIDSKGVIVCAFILRNSAFFTYASENEITVTTAPTKMKITGEGLVAAAKRTIDMVVGNIEEENALRLRLADERRKQQMAQTDDQEGDAE